MTQANELRIGNLVQAIGRDGYCEVTGIRKQEVKDGWYYSVVVNDEKENHLLPDHLLPIPLTPDILEKCGFPEIKNDILPYWQWKDKDGNCIEWHDDGSVLVAKVGECNHGFNMDKNPVTSLHQLQNLYYSLTGQELNYTP